MEHASRKGVEWAIATLLLGIGAAESPHPLTRLLCSLGAIGTGTKAVDCFTNAARAASQELAASREYRQLPSHAYYE